MDDDDEDDRTVVTSNNEKKYDTPSSISKGQTNATMNTAHKTSRSFKLPTDWAILDSGATAIFIMQDAPVKNITPTQKPLTVHMPQGSIEKSTHTCLLDIPQLPVSAR